MPNLERKCAASQKCQVAFLIAITILIKANHHKRNAGRCLHFKLSLYIPIFMVKIPLNILTRLTSSLWSFIFNQNLKYLERWMQDRWSTLRRSKFIDYHVKEGLEAISPLLWMTNNLHIKRSIHWGIFDRSYWLSDSQRRREEGVWKQKGSLMAPFSYLFCMFSSVFPLSNFSCHYKEKWNRFFSAKNISTAY